MPTSSGLIFNAHEVTTQKFGLGYDDVNLVPQFSDISLDTPPIYKTSLTKKFTLNIPILSASMDSITEMEMAKTMMHLGSTGPFHRMMDISTQVLMIKELLEFKQKTYSLMPVSASVGIWQSDESRIDQLVDAGVEVLFLEIVHGDNKYLLERVRWIKNKYPHVEVVAGNIATHDGARRLIESGVDAIKVGVGTGSLSMTRHITGHLVPPITAIALANSIASKYDIPIIADGGIRNSADIIKALAAGASCVMLGNLLSGSKETPGSVKDGKKLYKSMSSGENKAKWLGAVPDSFKFEGFDKEVPIKPSVEVIVKELLNALGAGMILSGCQNLNCFRSKSQFIKQCKT